MPRKHDAHTDELEGVAQRLRNERPEASPLELDRIKTTAMSRAQAGTRRGRAGARRLAVASLTVGLLAAGTGGVLAGQGSDQKDGNAASAQYGGNCDVNNGNGTNNGSGNTNGGNTGNQNGNGNGNNNFNCNENSFNTENTFITNVTTNNYNSSTVTITAGPANNGVLGTTTKKASTSKRPVKFRIHLSHKTKLRRVTLRVNGKVVSVLKGKKASANISIANLPCSATVTVTAVTTSGKTITQTHTYHLC